MALTRDELIAALRHTVETSLQQLVALQAADGNPGSLPDDEAEAAVSQASDDVYSTVVDTISAYSLAHNDERPRINRIPVELLCASLSHLHFEDLLTATHVCTGWRKLALKHATLWNKISTTNEQHLAAMLERSQAALLHVNVGMGTSRYEDEDRPLERVFRHTSLFDKKHSYNNLYAMLLPCMPRIHTLRIRDWTIEAPLEKLLHAPAPELVRFNLQTSGMHTSRVTIDRLFHGSAPRLRALTVYGMSLSSAALQNLRGLSYLELNVHLTDIADGALSAVDDIPEIVVHWESSSLGAIGQGLAAILNGLQGAPGDGRAALQLLPPSQSICSLISSENHIRVIVADSGLVREIRNIDVESAATYTLGALSENIPTLSTLAIAASLFMRCTEESLPYIEDLTIMLSIDNRTITEPGMLLEVNGRTPRLPQLKRLALDSVTYTDSFSSLFGQRNRRGSTVPSAELAAFIVRTGAKPALALIGVKASARAVSDPAYQSLVSAVASIESRA